MHGPGNIKHRKRVSLSRRLGMSERMCLFYVQKLGNGKGRTSQFTRSRQDIIIHKVQAGHHNSQGPGRTSQFTRFRQDITIHKVHAGHHNSQGPGRTSQFTRSRQDIIIHKVQTGHHNSQGPGRTSQFTRSRQDITIHKVQDFLRTGCYQDSEYETQVVSLGVRLPCGFVGGCKNCGRIHFFLLRVSLIVEKICSCETLEFPYQTVLGHNPN
jgi:hypothetical protein